MADGVVYLGIDVSDAPYGASDADKAPKAIKAIDNGDGTYSLAIQGVSGGTAVPVAPESSVDTAVTFFNASVNAAASTVVDAKATGGKRYCRVTVNCDNAHMVKFYGYTEDFAAITSAYLLSDYTKSGVAAVSGYGGNTWVIDCAGFAFFTPVVTNDGGDASTITGTGVFFD